MKQQRFRSVRDAIERSPAQAANTKARSEMMHAAAAFVRSVRPSRHKTSRLVGARARPAAPVF
jgi:predicted XRE-type DNA-binding protein